MGFGIYCQARAAEGPTGKGVHVETYRASRTRRAGVTTQEDERAGADLFKSLLTTYPIVTEAEANGRLKLRGKLLVRGQ